MINLNIVLFILLHVSLYFSIVHILNIYQQYHYDYKKTILSLKSFYLTKPYMFLSYITIIFLMFNNIILKIILIIVYFIMVFYKPKYVINLKYTNRIYRLIVTSVILIYIILIIFDFNILIFSIINIFVPFIILISTLINYPIDYIKKRHYIKLAKEKLSKNNNLVKIAITGSYGKTTTKHILDEVLNEYTITVTTPKSYNTILGICTTINEKLTEQTEILILEMGTNHIGEINKMCKLVSPNIGVITEIGPQHLSTFKNINNVLKAKLEIVDYMSYEDILILNGDNNYLKNIKLINLNNIYKVGKNNTNDYYVKNISIKNNIQTFDIYHGDKFIITVSTQLLGEHNINNILLAYMVIKQLSNVVKISDIEFAKKVYQIKPYPHRLSYRKQNNIHIFDDSYNSNIEGFKNAIKVINNQTNKKAIITPGIVDAGNDEKRLNEEIALNLINSFDEIYLIKNKVIKYYENIFIQAKKEYYIFDSFKEAYMYFVINNKEIETSLLIENDLPDIYLER